VAIPSFRILRFPMFEGLDSKFLDSKFTDLRYPESILLDSGFLELKIREIRDFWI
jgi:hypothetical protein